MKKRRKTPSFKNLLAVMLSITLMLSVKVYAHEEEILIVNPSSPHATQKELNEMVKTATEKFYQDSELKQELKNEVKTVKETIPTVYYPIQEMEYSVLTYGGKSMKFLCSTIGEPDANGKYPLYISLHGGGEASPEDNNDYWIYEYDILRPTIKNGIFIVCRGITDTWDLHFQEDSYPLYERLIEYMVVNNGADPDHVYMFGSSAGGDGVYQITPRLADRFAAANMSAGHPNGVSLLNLSNCYFFQQVGICDYYNEEAKRSANVARYDQLLSDYREKYGFGYEHKTFIHVPDTHALYDYDDDLHTVLKYPSQFANCAVDALNLFLDVFVKCGNKRDVSELSYYEIEYDEDFCNGIKDVVKNKLGLETEEAYTNAMPLLAQFTRNTAPEKFVWDLSTRASKRKKNSFYWLEADSSVNKGIITASYDKAENAITVEPNDDVNGDFAILFHPDLIDVTQPVTIKTPKGTRRVQVNPSYEFLRDSIYECGDPRLGCVGKIKYSELTSKDTPKKVSGNTPSKKSDGGHTHIFIWETTEATEETDGELRYQCEICGEVQIRVPYTAYNVFNKNTTEKIRNAQKDATVTIETNKWISCHKMVMEALKERPDVTLEISFLNEGYKGNRCTVVIPKGTDTMSLVDKNGFTGFLYLGDKFGLNTN